MRKNNNNKYRKKNNNKNKIVEERNKVIVHNDRSDEVRLNKYISETGICSRREADRLIEDGKVTINGIVAEMGTKVSKGQVVKVNGRRISKEEELVYIALNKPVGITCTTEKKIKGNIVDFVNHKKRIFPIGRLDKDSEGLIILTNDGDIVNKILRAGNNHDKEYIVTVDRKITDEFIQKMGSGVRILGTITKECFIKKESDYSFRIILTQGMNRQIRRMSEALGYEVKKLKRLRIMNIKLDNLKIGKWRDLTLDELKGLNDLIQESVKTKEIDE
ncbi:MAG: 23S rRNA pseudouridine(2604) synthase RluF [Clostridium sp.]|uniref:23S rRNA pseudouridine(2604) synthase RluF n=1 Tax=Clostridium sp. TaxID=1506 RepID=UPI003F33DD2E